MTDPYAPFPIGPSAPPAPFPRARLERAGVPASAVDELEAAFHTLPAEEREQLVDYVNGHSDTAIAERYGDGPPPAPVTRETLEAETVDELEDRIRAWNKEHEDDPEQHLAVSGRKGELIGRLLDAYEDESTPPAPTGETLPPAGAPSPTGTSTPSTVATGTVPTAPTPTTPEGAPTGTASTGTAGTAAPTGTAGTTTTGGTP